MRFAAFIVLLLAALILLPGCYEDMDGGAASSGPASSSSPATGSQSATDTIVSGPRQPALGKARDSAKNTVGALQDRSQQLADQIDNGGFDD